jgi:hypothetical protein
MTVDVYGHLVPGANRAAVNRLPGAGSRNGSPFRQARHTEKSATSPVRLSQSSRA